MPASPAVRRPSGPTPRRSSGTHSHFGQKSVTPTPPPRLPRAKPQHLPSSSSFSTDEANKSPYTRQRAITLIPTATPKTTPKRISHESPFFKIQHSPEALLHVPWGSPNGVLDSRTAALMEKSPNSLQRHLATSSDMSSVQQQQLTRSDSEEMDDMDFITEVDDESVVDDELQSLLREVKVYHNRQIAHYRRLLEQTQASASSQLHALQAEVRMLRSHLENERGNIRALELTRASPLVRMDAGGEEWDLADRLKVGFNERKVQRAVKALKRKDRLRLISIILDAMLPTDISEQIRLLEKYRRSVFDLVGQLPVDLGVNILRKLPLKELLNVSTVSNTWYKLVHHPSMWQYHTLELTKRDPYPPAPPPDPAGWESLYRRIYHRESNFRHGLAQDIKFLNGHNNFCTTVILKGKRLISGSYDETIRFWDIETGAQNKCLNVKKPVSCIDFLMEEEVFVCGFHDVGRVHVFSSVTFNALQQLQGHLYGIRAVALSSKHLVSAGADKALVCWDWRLGTKIVRFGQQTNLNIGVQIIGASADGPRENERVVSVTIEGVVRVFSILRREMISQFKLSELAMGDALLSQRIANVGAGSNNMLQWFAANGNQMTCATKNTIIHLQWSETDICTSPSSTSVTSETLCPKNPTIAVSGKQAARPSIGQQRVSSLSISRKGMPPPSAMPRRASGPGGSVKSNGRPSLAQSTIGIPPVPTPPTPAPSNRSFSASVSGLNTSIAGRAGVAATLTAPPKIVAVIETPDVAVGAMDPRKRRVVTATRFSSRAGAEREIFITTHEDRESGQTHAPDDDDTIVLPPPTEVYYDTAKVALEGTWRALAAYNPSEEPETPLDLLGLSGALPKGFQGLATPGMNPMSMALSHEEIVVGCADGTIYVMSMLGYRHQKPRSGNAMQESLGAGSSDGDSEDISEY